MRARAIRVVLVDALPVVREGLHAALGRERDISIVGEASSCAEAAVVIAAAQPHLTVLDIDLPDGTGFELMDALRSVAPDVRCVVFTASCRDCDIEAGLRSGVAGYLTKQGSVANVVNAVRHVHRGGGQYFCDLVSGRIVARRANPESPDELCSRLATLTSRETTVLRQLALGRAVKDVAALLHISPKTVDNHKTHMMAKLDIHDRVALCRYAVRERLVNHP